MISLAPINVMLMLFIVALSFSASQGQRKKRWEYNSEWCRNNNTTEDGQRESEKRERPGRPRSPPKNRPGPEGQGGPGDSGDQEGPGDSGRPRGRKRGHHPIGPMGKMMSACSCHFKEVFKCVRQKTMENNRNMECPTDKACNTCLADLITECIPSAFNCLGTENDQCTGAMESMSKITQAMQTAMNSAAS